MAKYRKKPVVIEAFRMGIDPMPNWFMDQVTQKKITLKRIGEIGQGLSSFDHSKTYCKIQTLEGEMVGGYGEFIIQGVNGEIYPCKPDIFQKTYTPCGTDNEKDQPQAQTGLQQQTINRLRGALAGLFDVDIDQDIVLLKKELEQMETALRMGVIPMSDKDRAAALNALHALAETA